MEEIKDKKINKRNPLLFVDIIVCVIQFFIGFIFSYFIALPITLLLHIFYFDKYGSFFIFTMWDVYLLTISNIIFWIKIYFDNRRLKK